MSTRSAVLWLAVLGTLAVAGGLLGGGSGSGSGGASGSSGSTADGAASARGGLDAAAGATLRARVIRVVDGDTVKVSAGGREDTVRYIGIDTPESVKPDTPVRCFGKEASARNEELVDGRTVRLVVGAEARDRYGRLLAYVYPDGAGTSVNETLAAEGYARTLTIRPNDRYAPVFSARVRAAQAAGRGLWGACRDSFG
ncbi:thermonuclease family protein [Paraconexibacter antarcticus]|uniref:Thermonuclease family protein n=1 Tax=Paraconexibacter antarcticus TaxID=2949664 RepID=A0ABY5DN07_9ACTN|nr:thermonuclease family protein [Paraconexibacter antarcticus]UTI63411.1 thermonuclease family protein [Paraconexibacter antarcticus]